MTWWEAALLGLVQGLTEFLPISSSGHLVLGQYLLGIDPDGGVVFEVFVHFGTVCSIIAVYRRRIVELAASIFRALIRPARLAAAYRDDEDFRMVVHIGLTLIPTGIVYLVFKDALEAAFSDPRLVCGMLLVTGALLLLTLIRKDPGGPIGAWKSLLIGLAQAAAMIPGISRSGSTICTALYLNVTPEKAANFSFLMLLPVVLGATAIKAFEVGGAGDVAWGPIVAGTLVAFVSGIAAILLVLDFVRKGRLSYFAWYCFAVGTAGLILI